MRRGPLDRATCSLKRFPRIDARRAVEILAPRCGECSSGPVGSIIGGRGSRSRLAPLVACAVIATGACSSEHDATLVSVTQSIVGGTPAASSDFPSAVAITVNGVATCSGVLITPTIVLSADHCFDPASFHGTGAPITAGEVRVYTGVTTVNPALPGLTVSKIDLLTIAPGSTHPNLSLLTLTTKATVTPARVNVDPNALARGAGLSVVGYGATRIGDGGTPDLSTNGVLRSAQDESMPFVCGSIAGPSQLFICFLRGTTCHDDGGPTFLAGTNVVAGIHSFSSCSDLGYDTRVDANLALLSPALCAADGYCALDCGKAALAPDPDCPTNDAGVATDGGGATDATTVTVASGGVTSKGGSGGSPGAAGIVGAGGTGAAGAAGAEVKSDGGAAASLDAGMAAGSGVDSRSVATSNGSDCGCRLSRDAGADRTAFAAACAACLSLVRRRRRRVRASRHAARRTRGSLHRRLFD